MDMSLCTYEDIACVTDANYWERSKQSTAQGVTPKFYRIKTNALVATERCFKGADQLL